MSSWIDQFNAWVDRLSVSVWGFHFVFGVALIGIQMLFLWLDGGLQAEELLPVIIFNGFATPFAFALIDLLDNQVVTAMNSMRLVLDTTEPEFDQYEYRLSNMPFIPPLIAGLAITAMAVFMPEVTAEPIRFAALEQLPVFAVVFHIIDKSSAFLFGVVIYHTFRQLRIVNSLSRDRIRVNLFNLGPLRAFSRVTASTAIGLVVYINLWMLINPDLLADPVNIGFGVIFGILTVSVFVWPLYGIHKLMQTEKERALHDIDLRLDAVFSKFNRRFQEDDYSAIGMLNAAISSLEVQHNRIKAIPTWPWSPETARIALTAIAVPIMITILQFLVSQVLD
jgi:hypothetical protein